MKKIIALLIISLISFSSMASDKSVAVLDFKYTEKSVAILGDLVLLYDKESKTDIFSDAVAIHLSDMGGLDILDRSNVTDLVLERELTGSENVFTGADYLVTGSILRFDIDTISKKIPYTDLVRSATRASVIVKYKVIDPTSSKILVIGKASFNKVFRDNSLVSSDILSEASEILVMTSLQKFFVN